MTFTKNELRSILGAIDRAIDYEKDLIEAHWDNYRNAPIKGSAKHVDEMKARIKRWKKIGAKIQGRAYISAWDAAMAGSVSKTIAEVMEGERTE